jgi:CheY-like chemotaxis protein
LRGHTVLIVDDEESIREIIEEGLSARGMEVHAVESSEAALSYLATNAREVILCDFNLPGLNGHQLFERLRARLSAAPPVFVFMTGDLVDEAVSAQFAGKGVSILQKPFHISALAALLAERLQPQPSKAD